MGDTNKASGDELPVFHIDRNHIANVSLVYLCPCFSWFHRCTFHGNIGSLCNRPCSVQYCKLLEHMGEGCDSCPDPGRGLGLMTFATAHALVTGRRAGLRERLIIQEQTGQWSLSGLVLLMKRVILTTLVFELLGAFILGIVFGTSMGLDLAEGAFYGLFHSVSAFCNAGSRYSWIQPCGICRQWGGHTDCQFSHYPGGPGFLCHNRCICA